VYYDRKQEAEKCEKARQKAQETAKAISDIPPDAKGAKQTAAALKKELAALEKRIKTYQKVSAEIDAAGVTDQRIYLGCGITSYFGQTSVCLYGGTVDLLRNTLRPTNFLNLGRLLESRARGCRDHSMGRVTGDPYDEKNPLRGLLNYKKSYGGNVVEYVGDLTLKGGTGLKMYVFTRLFPKIRHFRSTVMRRLINRRQS